MKTANAEFTCPRCGSHYFGRDVANDLTPLLIVRCHGDSSDGPRQCHWSGEWPRRQTMTETTTPFVWHGQYAIDALDRGDWRSIMDPLDRQHYERETRADAASQERTLRALQDAGFLRNKFSFSRCGVMVQAFGGWVRRENGKFATYTNKEAVVRLNELVNDG